MKQNPLFAYAHGSVQGSRHYALGMNNQDSFATALTETLSIGVVTDGCSRSGAYGSHTEVGAQIGATLLVATIKQYEASFDKTDTRLWLEKVYTTLTEKIRSLLVLIAADAEWIKNHWEFSIIGYVISEEKTVIFSCGDGIYSINGERKVIGPFPNNEPPYLLFSLFKEPPPTIDPSALTFTILEEYTTSMVEELWIATDGVEYLYEIDKIKPDNLHYPIVTLEELMNEEKTFKILEGNRPNLYLTRTLEKFTKEKMKIDYPNQETHKSQGILHDDTTVIMVKRL